MLPFYLELTRHKNIEALYKTVDFEKKKTKNFLLQMII